MASGASAVALGILITVLPFGFLLRLLQQLPPAIILSHRRWPLGVNVLLAVGVASACGWFFDRALHGTQGAMLISFEFLVAAAAYGFGLVLLLRQFCGSYEHFVITVGTGGLVLRKTSYSNIVKAEAQGTSGGETSLIMETANGRRIRLVLPSSQVQRFYDHVRKTRT